jgi:hypothetical protein
LLYNFSPEALKPWFSSSNSISKTPIFSESLKSHSVIDVPENLYFSCSWDLVLYL